MADVSFGRVPFAEQIAFFRQKLNVLTDSYLDVWGEQHDRAFMVAGANRDALLTDFREAIDSAIANGESLEDFRTRFDAIVEQHGWSYNGGRNWRSRVIYETNLRISYAAGRWQQLQALKQDRPYWLYIHKDGERHPRPLHQHWGDIKLTLHADDPWWHTHYPPNGWGCQCTVRALNARDMKKLGKDGPDKAPPIDMQQVTIGQRSPGGARVVETPAGVDPGFGYAPGRSVDPGSTDGFGALRAPPGVPPIRGRIAALYDAAFDALDARYNGLAEPAARAVHDIERAIAGREIELARAVDDTGATQVSAAGTADTVNLRPYLDQLGGLVLTHNHPGQSGFSFADIALAAYTGLREIRVVAPGYLYRLSPIPGESWSADLIALALPQSELRRDLLRLIAPYRRQLQRVRPRLDAAIIERLCVDRLALLLSRRYPLQYQVITR